MNFLKFKDEVICDYCITYEGSVIVSKGVFRTCISYAATALLGQSKDDILEGCIDATTLHPLMKGTLCICFADNCNSQPFGEASPGTTISPFAIDCYDCYGSECSKKDTGDVVAGCLACGYKVSTNSTTTIVSKSCIHKRTEETCIKFKTSLQSTNSCVCTEKLCNNVEIQEGKENNNDDEEADVEFYETSEFHVGVGAGGAVLLIIILAAILLGGCNCCCSRSKKKKNDEIEIFRYGSSGRQVVVASHGDDLFVEDYSYENYDEYGRTVAAY